MRKPSGEVRRSVALAKAPICSPRIALCRARAGCGRPWTLFSFSACGKVFWRRSSGGCSRLVHHQTSRSTKVRADGYHGDVINFALSICGFARMTSGGVRYWSAVPASVHVR